MNAEDIWYCVYTSVTGLSTLGTLIVLNIVTELKNLQGFLFRRYLASYFCYFVVLLLRFLSVNGLQPLPVDSYDSGITYFLMASSMWLNVIGFDIWRTFRILAFGGEVDSTICETRSKLVCYSIYAWGTPVVFFIIHQFSYPIIKRFGISDYQYRDYLMTSELSTLITVAVWNAGFYVLTAFEIYKWKCVIDNRHNDNEKWFSLYVKLYMVIGVRTIFSISTMFVGHRVLHLFAYGSVSLDSVLVFIILVEVKCSFRKLISKPSSIHQCRS